MSSVRIESTPPVTTVVLTRPEVRNAVDRPTAEALARAFRGFEHDEAARVAVLWGDHGTFCAGADLKALATGDPAYGLLAVLYAIKALQDPDDHDFGGTAAATR